MVRTETATQTLCCGKCGIEFAVPETWVDDRRHDHRTWYCPNGHPRHFPGKSSEEILRQRLSAAQDQLDTARRQRDHAERSARTYRGHLTRTKRRIAHGVCPCCNRKFAQLTRHMERKHPEYVEANGVHDKNSEPEAT